MLIWDRMDIIGRDGGVRGQRRGEDSISGLVVIIL